MEVTRPDRSAGGANPEIDGAKLRTIRQNLGLTMVDLAARIPMDPSNLAKIENGVRQRVRPPTMRRLADAVGVEPDALRPTEPAVAA